MSTEMSEARRASRVGSRRARTGFWMMLAASVPMLAVAWCWYGFAQQEAQSEQGKALAAGTSMAGFPELLGGVPLVLIHVIGMVALLALGWRGFRARGLVLAVVGGCVASAIGVGIAQALWAGRLFELGIHGG
jgi:hypothetical protein